MRFWRGARALWGDARWGTRLVALASAVMLLASVAAAYQLQRSDGPPSFARGGTFQGAVETEPHVGDTATDHTDGLDATTDPTPTTTQRSGDDAADTSAATDGHGGATTDTETHTGATGGGGTGQSGRTGETGGGSGPSGQGNGGETADDGLPRRGVYTYRVDGWEAATGFGRRDYPEEATLTAHRDADDLDDDEIVFDIELSSQHEEREIVAYRSDAVAFTFEGGSVTFGPRTETSEAEYEPPMVQIPLPLAEGEVRTGTSRAVDSDGDTVRTEDWEVRVQGRERIETGTGAVDTWVVTIDRQTRPGSSEQVERHRTYWYDPQRQLWVRWYEEMHGERDMGPVTFTYDTEYTATLEAFDPR